MELVLNTLVWATAATLVSQMAGVLIMWWLGVPPKKLAHEIEDVQNVAVGASFFIISLITAIFIGVLAADPSEASSTLASWGWIFGGLLLAIVYTLISFMIAHRMLGRIDGESVYTYVQRELVQEQNAALAFFLGGLAVAAFISVVGQII
jgi:hypothetical protein